MAHSVIVDNYVGKSSCERLKTIFCNDVTCISVSGENGTENYSERRLVIAEKVNVDDNFYRDVIDLVDTLLYSHQVLFNVEI